MMSASERLNKISRYYIWDSNPDYLNPKLSNLCSLSMERTKNILFQNKVFLRNKSTFVFFAFLHLPGKYFSVPAHLDLGAHSSPYLILNRIL